MSRKSWFLLGFVLIVLGAVFLNYSQFTYTTSEKIVEIGPVEATREVEKSVPLPSGLGATVLGAGVVSIVLGVRKRTN